MVASSSDPGETMRPGEDSGANFAENEPSIEQEGDSTGEGSLSLSRNSIDRDHATDHDSDSDGSHFGQHLGRHFSSHRGSRVSAPLRDAMRAAFGELDEDNEEFMDELLDEEDAEGFDDGDGIIDEYSEEDLDEENEDVDDDDIDMDGDNRDRERRGRLDEDAPFSGPLRGTARAALLDALRDAHNTFGGRLAGALGGGFAGGMMDSRIYSIIASLESDNDVEIQEGLRQLSTILLVPEDALSGLSTFPVDVLARVLVNLLRSNEDIEVLVMVARAMAQLVDNGFTGSTRALVHAEIIPVLRQRFENIGYIDLVEQLIRVVKPVAKVEPRQVLESGCLLPCIQFLDFFGDYIQKQILGAVDACAHAVSSENLTQARELLTAFPEQPNEVVISTACSLITMIAKNSPQDVDLRDVVSPQQWDILVAHITPVTPHVSRVLKACSHLAARCPDYVTSPPTLALTVAQTLIPNGSEVFSTLLATPKETLFAGLKLLQVLLPLPPPISEELWGPYRKAGPAVSKETSLQDLEAFAAQTVPLATAIYNASTSTPVRQLALLVILQSVVGLQSHPDFPAIAQCLDLVQTVAHVVADASENLVLLVGALDIAWELVNNSDVATKLASSGISGDLEVLLDPATVSEPPHGGQSPTGDLNPVVKWMASGLLQRLHSERTQATDLTKLFNDLREGHADIDELLKISLPDLLRAGLLDVLAESPIRGYLGQPIVSLLQAAVTRLDKFDLQLTGSHADSLEAVLGRLVNVQLAPREHMEHTCSVSVPAVATLRSLEEFVRTRLARFRILNNELGDADAREDQKYVFYSGDMRLPRDISVLKAIYGQSGMPLLTYEAVPENTPEPVTQEKDEPVANGQLAQALELLKTLATENESRGQPVPLELFTNAKLTAKLTRQMADVLAVSASMLPQWTFDTVHEYPFIYPLKTRLHFVQLTSFGMGRNLRLLRQMQQEADDDEDLVPDEDDTDRILGRHRRQKFRLSRERLLEGSLKLLELSCRNPAVLDVIFIGEEGTGRGPTQEFFALASRELSSPASQMWRETQLGLFPASAESPSAVVLKRFEGMGRLVARALLDKRILDFQLNPAFFEAVLSDSPPSVAKLQRVDAPLAASLNKLLDASPEDVKAMGLDFTLPGTDIELIMGGSDIEVTSENAGEYVYLITDRLVGSGIERQVRAFSSGFASTIPVSALRAFMLDELATLCGAGRSEDWSESALQAAFKADHGYRMDSRSVQMLIKILAGFSDADRRKFLMFATGSPHLPIGGFKALTPPFTVVIKHPENAEIDRDTYLPSVMTCVNYLKLPNYSSESIMRDRLSTAMREGSEAFPLS